MKRTKYEILGVKYSASLEEVKQAFREKVKTLHPDENGNNTEVRYEELLAVLEAYEILKDEEKLKAMGVADADAIADYYGLEKK